MSEKVEERIAEWEELSKRATFSGVAYEELQSRAPEMADWLISELRAALASSDEYCRQVEVMNKVSNEWQAKAEAATASLARMRGIIGKIEAHLDNAGVNTFGTLRQILAEAVAEDGHE